MGTVGIIGIGTVIVGVIIILIAFFTFRRSSENEVSKDIFISPLFIVGAAMVIAGIIMGVMGLRQ